jgi:hypothetical protein
LWPVDNSRETLLINSSSAFLSKFLGVIAFLAGGTALAAPTITVTKVSNTSTQMTIKVTGSGFTRGQKASIEIDSNFADSGNFAQTVDSITVDSGGKISTTITKFLNASCAIGVVAFDTTTGAESGGKNLSYGSPCLPSTIEVHRLAGGTPSAIEWTPSHFTPTGSVSVELRDLTGGTSVYTDFFVGSNGKYTTHYNFGVCNHTIQLIGYDDYTDTPCLVSPTIVTCK